MMLKHTYNLSKKKSVIVNRKPGGLIQQTIPIGQKR